MHLPKVKTGLEVLLSGYSPALASQHLGLIQHPASVTSNLTLAADALIRAGFKIERLFSPQHGARGEKQDNMVESPHDTDTYLKIPVYSLYSETRKPTSAMLEGLDALLFDLQDVGTRVYTYIWTMELAMEACAQSSVKFIVLDRPNPIGLTKREGPLLREGFESFVGLQPLPLRHGLTCGEIARWLQTERGINCQLEVIPCKGLQRKMLWQDTGLPYVMPSPNLPASDSCGVYPGMVLLEGTNISEGRGTTRPFEIFGAPWLDGRKLVNKLREKQLQGAFFRECFFEPTFGKFRGQLCTGAQIHVTDRLAYETVGTAVEILSAIRRQQPDKFAWRNPPYEYEEKLAPIDILWGSDNLRIGLENGMSATEILAGTQEELKNFVPRLKPYLLYD